MSNSRAFAKPMPVRCAVTRCHTVVERGKLMCFDHWSMVPTALQREIGQYYRARQMGNYQSAYSRAVDHVESATGVFTGILEKRADRDPARKEGGDFSPITPPSKAVRHVRVRRPRLTVRRLAAMEKALQMLASHNADYAGALLWVRGERAKRRARKAVRA